MSSQTLVYVVAGVAGVLSLGVWAGLVLVPAWSAYSRLWERVLAAVLSLYVLAAMVLAGAGVGAGVLWYWDQL